MEYEIIETSKFRKDYRRCIARNYNIELLKNIINNYLTKGMPLPAECKDHPLKGEYAGKRDCHILPNWILIYTINETEKFIVLERTGSHSDLF